MIHFPQYLASVNEKVNYEYSFKWDFLQQTWRKSDHNRDMMGPFVMFRTLNNPSIRGYDYNFDQ